jgi:hypothetical protein
MRFAVADDEVSNVASEYQARSMGIPVLTPSVYEPWGVETADGPVPRRVIRPAAPASTAAAAPSSPEMPPCR